MLALVRTPRINEIAISGEDAEAILKCLQEHFSISIISLHGVEDENELLDANSTEYAQKNHWRVLSGYRLKAGLTQKQLADMTGIRQSVISEYECGKRALTQTAAIKLGEALKIDPRKLMM